MTRSRLKSLWRSCIDWPGAPYLAAFVFYLLTIAPTVLWGDDAEFQRRAFTLELGAGITDHPLYLAWAHLFTCIPLGDIAFRVNLCSALGAAIGIGLVHALLRLLGAGPRAAWLGAGALAVSHAYWMHAVRAEVYSTYLALTALFLLAGLRWLATERVGWLALASFVLALSLSIHVLALTALPGLLILAFHTKNARHIFLSLAGFVAGLIPLALFMATIGAGELGPQLLDTLLAMPAPARWPGAAALFAGFLLYQFPLALPLACLGLRRLWREQRPQSIFLMATGLGNVVAAFDLQVPDRHVFYLPSYVIVALLIGFGSRWLLERRRTGRRLAFATLLLPVAIYIAVPGGLNALNLNPLGFRDLPYRNGNWFQLLPAKSGYTGPRQFGQDVLESLPAEAVVLADHTIRQNLLFLQVVEGRRPDVDIVEIYSGQGQQLPYIQSAIEERPVFVGAIDRYLDHEEIAAQYAIEPFGLIYQIVPRGGAHARSD
jgi:hypothetical protein